MFQLRPDHMDALSREQDRLFADRMVEFLREQFADAAAMPVPELRPGVEGQIAKGEGYGLEMEQELATYVMSAWLLGEDFDTRFPAAEAVLLSPELSGEEKRAWLDEFTQEMFKRLEQK